jgi:hypothetical protein
VTELTVVKILVVGLVMAVVFTAGLLLELKRALHTEKLCHAAARWLANRNYVELAAYRDVIYRRYGVTLLDLRKDLSPALGAMPKHYLAQSVPLMRVPKELVVAAMAYNRATDKLAGTDFEAQWLDTKHEVRVADLESALLALVGRKWEDYAPQVAEESGVSTCDVQRVLCVYVSLCMAEVERHVGTLQDPEEILPSIY